MEKTKITRARIYNRQLLKKFNKKRQEFRFCRICDLFYKS